MLVAAATPKALAGTDVLTRAFVRVFRPAAASFGLARVTPKALRHESWRPQTFDSGSWRDTVSSDHSSLTPALQQPFSQITE